MTQKINIDKKRYIGIAMIITLVLPAFFITAYAGEVGVYVGAGMFMLVGWFAMFETFSALGFNKYLSAAVGLIVVPFFLMEFDNFKGIATLNNSNNGTLPPVANANLALDWKSYLIVFLASFIPVLAQPKVASKKMNIFLMQLIVSIIVLITVTFIKGLWSINAGGIPAPFYFILIAVTADSFGYFGGKYFGKKLFKGAKLAPKLSPKKTWAGAVIGFVASVTFAALFGYYLHVWESIPHIDELAMSLIMAVILSLISPFGDLMFSAIKRKVGIKDFSNFIPGHGGVYDRIDAMATLTTIGLIVYIIFG